MISLGRCLALLDANVLYPALMRGLLLELAYRELYGARWSKHIEEEWTRSLRKNRPDLDSARIERTCRLMSLHFPEAIVTGYESKIGELSLPDANDRHVLAAAIVGDCDVIVTQNLRDFPAETLDEYGIEARHPDSFLAQLLEDYGESFLAAARAAKTALRNPAYSVDQFLRNLERQNLSKTAMALRNYAVQLD